MKHVITIDDRSEVGQSLIELLKKLSKTTKSVGFVDPKILEELEDASLLILMEEGLQSGEINREEVMKTLKGIAGE